MTEMQHGLANSIPPSLTIYIKPFKRQIIMIHCTNNISNLSVAYIISRVCVQFTAWVWTWSKETWQHSARWLLIFCKAWENKLPVNECCHSISSWHSSPALVGKEAAWLRGTIVADHLLQRRPEASTIHYIFFYAFLFQLRCSSPFSSLTAENRLGSEEKRPVWRGRKFLAGVLIWLRDATEDGEDTLLEAFSHTW